jgi:hypothetical protein
VWTADLQSGSRLEFNRERKRERERHLGGDLLGGEEIADDLTNRERRTILVVGEPATYESILKNRSGR